MLSIAFTLGVVWLVGSVVVALVLGRAVRIADEDAAAVRRRGAARKS